MILAALVVLGFGFVVFVDWVYLRRRHLRAFLLELVGFSVVVGVALRADLFDRLAALVGVQRGIDLILYPMFVWLFREAVLGRVRFYQQQSQITAVVRQVAIASRVESPERAA